MLSFLLTGYILLWFTIGFRLWLTILFIALSFFLITYARQFMLHLIAKLLYFLNNSNTEKNYCFILTECGECQFSHEQKLQISTKSQINLWGYWLVFTDNTRTSQFIFKDGLSVIDQARIGRTINRVKQFKSNIADNKPKKKTD